MFGHSDDKAETSEVVSPVKRCPFCAEEILVDAKKCRYCGEFLDQMSGRSRRLDVERIVATCGSLLLVVTPFAPMVTAPIFGRITLFQQGKGDGIILLVVALAALCLSMFGKFQLLWLSGSMGLAEIGNLLRFFYIRLPEAISNYRATTKSNPFGSIIEFPLINLDLDSGAAALVLGTVASLGVVIHEVAMGGTMALSDKLGLSLLALVVIGHLTLLLFPYLIYLPSLFHQ